MEMIMDKKRVFSGIQPSGDIHIGNYLGAVKNWVKMQDDYDCIFCVVDYHAITVDYEPEDLRKRVFNGCADLMACGIDPKKSKIFVQSMVPAHTELSWILASKTSFGDLERMTQFKSKAVSNRKNINAGLFTYPVLMSADIAIYKAELVPVGDDQIQHLELSREIIRKFNKKFGDIFPEAKGLANKGARVMGLDGKNKMSKSLNNYIGIMEDQESVMKKLAGAKTDENRKRLTDPGDPQKCNLFRYHEWFSDKETREYASKGCTSGTIGCFDCKKRLAESIYKTLEPIQKKRKEYDENPELVYNAIREGAAWCATEAEKTMQEVKTAIGVSIV